MKNKHKFFGSRDLVIIKNEHIINKYSLFSIQCQCNVETRK